MVWAKEVFAYWVVCDSCQAEGPKRLDEEEAIQQAFSESFRKVGLLAGDYYVVKFLCPECFESNKGPGTVILSPE